MKIIFFCYGSNGDVRPYSIIARELIKKGHSVKIIIDRQLKYVTDSFEIESYTLDSSMPELKFSKNKSKLNVGKYIKKRIKQDRDRPENLNIYYHESIGCDLIITNHFCIPESVSIQEKLNIPFIPIFLLPLMITKNEPCIYISKIQLSSILNKISHQLFWKLISKKEKIRIDKWRKEYLGLKELKDSFFYDSIYKNKKIIQLFDKTMFLKKKIPKDYKENCINFGFILNKELNFNQIPIRLLQFLNLNSVYDQVDINASEQSIINRPIVFGLGSMSVDDELILPALKYAINKFGINQKWIILNNWSNFENLELLNNSTQNYNHSHHVIQFNNIDHIWLYKFCSIVITHGGIGSCASVLNSAIPSIITPLSFDQPIWAYRFKKLGISETLNIHKLKEDDLYNTISLIKSNYKQYKLNCLKIHSELDNNSLEKTINYIENFNK